MTKPKKRLTDLEMIDSLIELCRKAIKDFETNPAKHPQRKNKTRK